jgi:hypothetical protein
VLWQHPMKGRKGPAAAHSYRGQSTMVEGMLAQHMSMWVYVQAAVGSTDTSSDSVVTVGLPPQPTPQHSPRGTSPAGLVLKCPVPLRLFSPGMSITVFIAIPVSFLVFNISCCFCWWSCKCFWLTLDIRSS